MKINEKTIRNYLSMLNEESIKHLTTYQYEHSLRYVAKLQCVCGEYAIIKYTNEKKVEKRYFRNTFDLLEYIDKELNEINKSNSHG